MGMLAEAQTARTDTKGADGVIASYAPASGELLGTARVSTPDDVRDAVARARVAQKAWGLLPVEERGERLLRFRDAMVDRAEAIIDLLARETGKPPQEALSHELFVFADMTTWYAKNAPRILAPRELDLHLLKHRRSVVHYAPRGVVGIISPWNFPLVIPFTDAVAALVTGSAVVIKPSDVTPLIALEAKKVWDSTGLPEDLLQIVIGRGDVGAALIKSGVNKIVFTGGVETGKRVAAACGAELVPCVMELGGKAPFIVCSDADVERAAQAIVFGGFANSGQVCISVERVLAHESVYDRVVGRVTDLVGELRQGDAGKGTVDVGAMIFAPQIDVVEKHVQDAVAKGARVETGGRRGPGPGQFYEPTVLSNCRTDMTVMREEIFGPIVPIMKVASEDEAVAVANESHLGLNAYVFTTDRDKGRRLAERISAGSVVVNDVFSNYASAEAPFGGVKQSGFGRVHGEDALREMAEVRHVSFDRFKPPSKDPIWYPYSKKSYQWSLRGLRLLFSGRGLIQKLGELF